MSASINGKYGRVFDGRSFQDVVYDPLERPLAPVPPITTAGPSLSTIFVSIPQFRDGKRCARTLRRLFRSASHPDRIAVGLVEQTDTEHPKADPTCLEEYCKLEGYEMGVHKPGVAHKGERQADWDRVIEGCPRAREQVRSVRFHHHHAKGPVYARSFIRKVLGNEEFCMQIDAATDFAQGWDDLAIKQWVETGNEYAVLSNVPMSDKEREKNGDSGAEVPRQCAIKIGSEGVPLFENVADGKAIGLTRPLLSTTQSSSFAFAKCHYETNVPHDPFAVQLLETEKFPRFARLWTRGYDVYTPSLNIVYRDNVALHPLHHTTGHGESGERKWPKNDGERRDAHVRMKVLLDIHHGITPAEIASLGGAGGAGIGGKISAARANLGIYGLGRRRTLEQLLEFTGIALPGRDFTGQHGNDGNGCSGPAWVPYDVSISGKANLFDGTGTADDLDPEPIFPLRTMPDATGGQYDHPFAMGNAAWDEMTAQRRATEDGSREASSSDVPYSVVFLLWIAGLYVWFGAFAGGDGRTKRKGVTEDRLHIMVLEIQRQNPV
eukprot:CAMPEP_0172538584 /NCGR_PEP_ID=MMETSP1067-20121228/9951_1 /TAXON_ID=265564 ORGANISM="Thalassiosira punctigera, Strain Tpunct2005C2" /NCGR_SAMPLE_ID=MMETSP1067 /ASSEMBLY_ACC=CAM_ASM_000444 /LENGTH=549 /DNA_ID=CAMNT_0013324105 /DNA_START=250 /DNA_END=1900 /DNA_ORIENTATION=-